VLVSGASGFVATWTIHAVLEKGHYVRGTVRSGKKGEYLRKLFGNRFEYVIVEDIGKDGAFDEAVKDMDAVIHTASPFHLDADDPQEIIGPAVNGTTSILHSVLKFGHGVGRVVITSSSAAIESIAGPKGFVYTEKTWNNMSGEIVKRDGRNAPQTHKYRASKTLAELAAWEFVDKYKDVIKWNLITLQPPYIFGPVIHEVASVSSLNTSSAKFLNFLKNEPPLSASDLVAFAGNFVDVRDVGLAHAEALTNQSLANNDLQAAISEGKGRVILSSGPWTWQDVADALMDSSIPLPESVPRGERGAGAKTVPNIQLDSTRAKEILGIKFRSITETFGDTLEDFREKGWVQ